MKNRNSGLVIRVVCYLVFCLFVFLYLYDYQNDVLAYEQHVLSHGETTYNRTLGAILITFASLFLAIAACRVVDAFSRLFEKNSKSAGGQSNANIYRRWWMKLSCLLICLLTICAIGNNNDVFHYRLAAERYIGEGNYDAALHVGDESLSTDSSLTMLRALALSRKGQLGERLFEYPLTGGSAALYPKGNVKFLMLSQNVFYTKKKLPADYILTGYLLDCNLDSFAQNIGKYYHINDSLPKHYREALTLYTHLRSYPKVIYQNSVMDADFNDLMDMQKKYPERRSRMTAIRDTYGNTYWCYYLLRTSSKAFTQSVSKLKRVR